MRWSLIAVFLCGCEGPYHPVADGRDGMWIVNTWTGGARYCVYSRGNLLTTDNPVCIQVN